MSQITLAKPSPGSAEISIRDGDALTLLLGRAGRRIRAGRLSVVTPSGAQIGFKGAASGPSARIILHRWRALYSMAMNGDVGLGRSYVRGDWDSPDLPALIAFLACNVDGGARETLGARFFRPLRHAATRLSANTLEGSRRNIAYHYDIGNDFYRTWLDSSWTYSAALFEGQDMTLEQAQAAKYRRIAQGIGLGRGDHVLEIGCGWGSFALFAAREYGARVTGITLSTEQLALARQRAAAAGLSEDLTFHLLDYRKLVGSFDHVVSIEMLEAVGEKYWPTYFDTVARCLAPGGRAAIQSIVIDPAAFGRYRRGSDFIRAAVFPGGMLPTAPLIAGKAARAGLKLNDEFLFGPHYAKTLRLWRRKFSHAVPRLTAQGMDEAFLRLWSYFLAYCEGGFQAGRIDVGQWIFEKSGLPVGTGNRPS